jgi:integrase/recombinase XerD
MRKKMEMNSKAKEKSFDDGMKDFILNCKVRNLSKHTIYYYGTVEKLFTKYFNPNQTIESITKSTVDGFIMYIRENTNENFVTQNTMIRGLRAILYFFMKNGWMAEFKISLIKEVKEVIETYSNEEIKVLLRKPDVKSCSYSEYRDWTICNFILACGCRSLTLVNIKNKDLDFVNDLILYTVTKNKKQQLVPMSKTIKTILQEYVQIRKGEPDDLLFVNTYGTQLNKNSLGHSLVKYNRKRGIVKTGTHRWRHTFAKLWILNNGDMFRLQKMLGHSSLDVVREYVDMFTNDLQKDFDVFNPLENLTDKKTHIKMK